MKLLLDYIHSWVFFFYFCQTTSLITRAKLFKTHSVVEVQDWKQTFVNSCCFFNYKCIAATQKRDMLYVILISSPMTDLKQR